jgi:DNA invertase Pin-like site-specific DNA recombinase
VETRENKTAVIYARVSSTGDRQSTERQVQDLNEYAEYRGLDLVRVFEEHISGAKRNEERPVLTDAVEFCLENRVGTLLVSELSRLGRNAFEVLSTVKTLADNGVNLYLQKEQLSLLDDEGKTSLFFPIVIATLSTCAQLERENIQFRLSSGREQYKKRGGKLGRPIGTVKSKEKMREEYRDVIAFMKKGYSIRDVARLTGRGVSTVQRVKSVLLREVTIDGK